MCPDPLLLSKFVLSFYNRVNGVEFDKIENIPADALAIILNMRYTDLIAEDVRRDREKNLSLRFLSVRYGVGVRVIRTIVSQ